MGTAKDLDTTKAEFKAGWEALKGQNPAGTTRGGVPAINMPSNLSVVAII